MVFIIIIIIAIILSWLASTDCLSVRLVPMFCDVFILFVYPLAGAGARGLVVDTAGNWGASFQ